MLGEALDDWFGWSVALSADGGRLAIGAPFYNDLGRVQVFEWIQSGWNQIGSDLMGDTLGDYYGSYVGISDDGDRLIVGASGYDYQGMADCGMARVYELRGGGFR